MLPGEKNTGDYHSYLHTVEWEDRTTFLKVSPVGSTSLLNRPDLQNQDITRPQRQAFAQAFETLSQRSLRMDKKDLDELIMSTFLNASSSSSNVHLQPLHKEEDIPLHESNTGRDDTASTGDGEGVCPSSGEGSETEQRSVHRSPHTLETPNLPDAQGHADNTPRAPSMDNSVKPDTEKGQPTRLCGASVLDDQ
ncbi:hypothetical protein V5O48_016569, partial [Marasmius crinis-equi]